MGVGCCARWGSYAPNTARLGMGAEESPGCGVHMGAHRSSQCVRNLEAGAVSHGGKVREGRGRTPQKLLIRKKSLDLVLA